METTNTWRLDLSRGVPQRREKRKNLSGSADIPKWLIMIIAENMACGGHRKRLLKLEKRCTFF
jgi:hypothetical protein